MQFQNMFLNSFFMLDNPFQNIFVDFFLKFLEFFIHSIFFIYSIGRFSLSKELTKPK